MSTSRTGKKRKAAEIGDNESSGRPSTSAKQGGGQHANQSDRRISSYQPFAFVADLANLDPQDLLDVIEGLSAARYARDLYMIFNQETSSADAELVTMHKDWFECRNPTANELWASKYKETQSYKPTETKNIIRTVLTLETMRAQLEGSDNAPLAQRLMVLHFDYIMLMSLNEHNKQGNRDGVTRLFPTYKEQFESIADELRRTRSSMPFSKGQASLIMGDARPASEGQASLIMNDAIATATREMINSLRVDAKSVSGRDNIAGCIVAKKAIRNAVSLGAVLPHLADTEYGWKGILLHGPPGTGKTKLALSVAAEGKCNVFHVLSSNIVDKYVGATERNIRALFTIAQENTPSVVFIDEVDALFSVRETKMAEANVQRLKSEFLSALTMYSKVVVIGATNLPWALDSAFLRRFDRHIHIGLPDRAERVEIFKLKLSTCLHELEDADLEDLAEHCDGFAGDTIRQAVAHEWNAMYDKIEEATHFRKASLKGRVAYCTCLSSHPAAEKLDFRAISGLVYPEPITKDGLLSAIDSLQRTVAIAKAGEKKHARWSSEMFQEL